MNREGNFVFHYSCSSAVKLSSTTQCNNSFRRREVITAFARLYARSHKTVLSSYLSLICRTTSNFQIKVMKHMLVNTQFKDSPSPWQIQNCVIFFPMEQKSILSNTTGDGNENTFGQISWSNSKPANFPWVELQLRALATTTATNNDVTIEIKRLRVFSNLIAVIPTSFLKCQL